MRDHISGIEVIRLMRAGRVTIARLAKHMRVTQTWVRHVRLRGVSGDVYVRDWLEGISGSAAAVAPGAGIAPGRTVLAQVHPGVEVLAEVLTEVPQGSGDATSGRVFEVRCLGARHPGRIAGLPEDRLRLTV